MERHWQAVTRRLVEATVKDMAALNDLYDEYKTDDEYGQLIELARDRLKLSFQVLPAGDLPREQQRPFFSLLDYSLSEEISKRIRRPFWIDTVGRSALVEVRVRCARVRLTALRIDSRRYRVALADRPVLEVHGAVLCDHPGFASGRR